MEAIIAETKCLVKNDTWKIVNRPKDKTVIGCRTVLRNKYKADGTIERRKVRVARGFTQRPGIDFHDTFTPVVRLESVRLLLALPVKFNLKVHHFDVTSAYLNGSIKEEIYMEKPKLLFESLEEIVDKRGKSDPVGVKAMQMIRELRGNDKVCFLKKSLYGLKQAGR